MADKGGNVKVVLRVRPLNSKEKERGGHSVFDFIDEKTVKVHVVMWRPLHSSPSTRSLHTTRQFNSCFYFIYLFLCI